MTNAENSHFRSKPVYAKLEVNSDASHSLFIADGDGAQAILDLSKSVDSEFWNNSEILFLKNGTGDKFVDALGALGAATYIDSPDYSSAQSVIQKSLGDVKISTQLYLAGSESVIGQCLRDAMSAGFSHLDVQKEHRGTSARRMQCVHCKGITENVTTDPFECAHCGDILFVRDHYSRRLAAYQGVRVDAEVPGDIPKTVEL